MDLGCPVGLVASLGAFHHLVLFHQVPPQFVEILVGIFVHLFFKPVHHLCPAAEDQLLEAEGLEARLGDLHLLFFADACHVF